MLVPYLKLIISRSSLRCFLYCILSLHVCYTPWTIAIYRIFHISYHDRLPDLPDSKIVYMIA